MEVNSVGIDGGTVAEGADEKPFWLMEVKSVGIDGGTVAEGTDDGFPGMAGGMAGPREGGGDPLDG